LSIVATLIFSFSLFSTAFTQEDSIIIECKIKLKSTQSIKEKAKFYYELSENYGFKNLDSSLVYAQKLVNLYDSDFDKDTSFIKLIANGYNNIGVLNRFAGKIENTFSYLFKAAEMLEIINDKPSLTDTYNNISIIYSQAGNYSKSLEYRYKVVKLSKELNDFAKRNFREVFRILERYFRASWRCLRDWSPYLTDEQERLDIAILEKPSETGWMMCVLLVWEFDEVKERTPDNTSGSNTIKIGVRKYDANESACPEFIRKTPKWC